MKKQLLFICFLLFGLIAQAQDMQFTQFYAAQTYLNPAFTGANACSRLAVNYRNQWPSIPGAFVSNIVSYDHFVRSINSGLGILFTNDRAGSGNLRSTSFNLLYAYELAISKKWGFRAGFQASGTTRDIDFNELVFGDQIERDGAPVSVEYPAQERIFYFDVSTGGLLYSNRHWIGFAAHHLNKPNQSLILEESEVYAKYSLHAGTKIPLGNEDDDVKQFLSPAVNYKSQGKFDQVDAGLYYSYGILDLGAWYRGIPVLKSYKPGYSNNDAIALLAGITYDRLRFGYSYDFTVSRLIKSTGGAHEISLSYQFCKIKYKRKKSTRTLLVPCPKF